MTTNTPDDSIRKRIEACLRIAEDPTAPQGERDSALDRVATLTEKYKIDASRLDPHSGQWIREDIVVHTFHLPTTYGLSTTRHHGIYQVVQAMGADCYVVKQGHARRNGGQRYVHEGLTVHALESTMHVLKVLIPSLVLQETTASTAFVRTLKESDHNLIVLQDTIRALRGGGADPKLWTAELNKRIRTHRKSFAMAFFVEAADRIREKRSDAVQEAGKGYALVAVDNETRIQQSMADLDLSDRKTRKDAKYSARGWDGGTEAGRQALVGQTEVHGGRLAIEGC
jgi:hypothetical protein